MSLRGEPWIVRSNFDRRSTLSHPKRRISHSDLNIIPVVKEFLSIVKDQHANKTSGSSIRGDDANFFDNEMLLVKNKQLKEYLENSVHNGSNLTVSEDQVMLTVRIIAQPAGRGITGRWTSVSYVNIQNNNGIKPTTDISKLPTSHNGFCLGFMVADFTQKEIAYVTAAIFSLDEVKVERVGETSFMLSQVYDTTNSSSFTLQAKNAKIVEAWLKCITQLVNFNAKLQKRKFPLYQVHSYDILSAKKIGTFTKQVEFVKEEDGNDVYWILSEGLLEDCVEWGLLHSTKADTEIADVTAMFIYFALHHSFDDYFSIFLTIWRRHVPFCMISTNSFEGKKNGHWLQKLQFLGEQMARSYAIFSLNERGTFVEFCIGELGVSKCSKMKEYLTENTFKSGLQELSYIHQTREVQPQWETTVSGSEVSIYSVNSKSLAQQLTIIESMHHQEITIQEFANTASTSNTTSNGQPVCVGSSASSDNSHSSGSSNSGGGGSRISGGNGTKKSVGGMQMATDWWNKISLWVATQILTHSNVKNRVRIMKKFIKVAQHLFDWHNFNSCAQILSGINHNAVQRSKRLIEMLPPKYSAIHESLSKKFSHVRNYSRYRKLLQSVNGPCIRFLAVHQRDLIFIVDGNSQFNDKEEKVVNFERALMLANCLRSTGILDPLNNFNIKFQPNVALQTLICTAKPLGEEELYELSTKYEPAKQSNDTVVPPTNIEVTIHRNPLFGNPNLVAWMKTRNLDL